MSEVSLLHLVRVCPFFSLLELVGVPLRSTFDSKQTIQFSSLVSMLTRKARTFVRDVEPLNDLEFFRLVSAKTELLVSPGKDYILVVIQDLKLSEA